MERVVLFSVIIGTSLTICMGQMDLATLAGLSAMGGMGSGGIGMGGMGSGGMGAGGMGASGMGGVAGMAAIAGRVSNPRMAPMVMNNIVTTMVTKMIKTVIGPHANPTTKIINYAMGQLRMPVDIHEVPPYVEMMQEMSKTTGVALPDGTIKLPGTQSLYGSQAGQPTTAGSLVTKGTSTPIMDPVMKLIIDRSLAWFNSQRNTAMYFNSLIPLWMSRLA